MCEICISSSDLMMIMSLHRCLQKSKYISRAYLGTISLLANACVSKKDNLWSSASAALLF